MYIQDSELCVCGIKVSTDSNSKFINSIEKFFCRSILGVDTKSQSSAVRGELGPLGRDLVANINYQNHVESKHPNSFLGEAWLTNSTVQMIKGKLRVGHNNISKKYDSLFSTQQGIIAGTSLIGKVSDNIQASYNPYHGMKRQIKRPK